VWGIGQIEKPWPYFCEVNPDSLRTCNLDDFSIPPTRLLGIPCDLPYGELRHVLSGAHGVQEVGVGFDFGELVEQQFLYALRQAEAFEVALSPVERLQDAPKGLSGQSVSPVVIVNDDAPAVCVAVDSCSGGSGTIQGKSLSFQRADDLSNRGISKQMSQPADIAHTVIATAGSSITSEGPFAGMGSPCARRDSM